MLNSNRNTGHHPQHRTGGFTLLEVLVALSIIAIVFVSVLRLQGQTIAMTETVRFYSVAPFLAQSKMAEVRMDPEAFIPTAAGEFKEDFTRYKWEVALAEKEIQYGDQSPLTIMETTVTITLEPDGLRFTLVEYQDIDTDII